jgi:hypothetical protein
MFPGAESARQWGECSQKRGSYFAIDPTPAKLLFKMKDLATPSKEHTTSKDQYWNLEMSRI